MNLDTSQRKVGLKVRYSTIAAVEMSFNIFRCCDQ